MLPSRKSYELGKLVTHTTGLNEMEELMNEIIGGGYQIQYNWWLDTSISLIKHGLHALGQRDHTYNLKCCFFVSLLLTDI